MSAIRKLAKNNATTEDFPPLDRYRADEILEPDADLWGLKSIAACLGVATETARRWAGDPTSGLPVNKLMGRWFGRKRAILAWQRTR